MRVSVRILDNPALRCDDSGSCFQLLDPMRCEALVQPLAGEPWPVLKLVVPSGFITDFASIPRLFHPLLPKLGRYNRPAILHDWLYAAAVVGKDLADRIFLAAMEATGVSLPRRELMFVAVRYFGWIVWRHHRRRGAKNG